MLRNSSHIFTPKNHQKVVPGDPFGSQNGAEFSLESPEIHEMLQKNCFLTLPFFEQISRQKKTHFFFFERRESEQSQRKD